ncbi:MAG TPA: chloride channel protein, partial [Anaerolineae bacterium]|nr:chloride channel protein [Anaerolineae bacterium]
QVFRLLRLASIAWFERRLGNRWARLLLGAAITGLIAYGVVVLTRPFVPVDIGLRLVLASGESAINMAFAGQLTLTVALIGLMAKVLATLATISSGGSAGLLVPSLFFGTMVATIFAKLGGLPETVLIVPALTASLVAVVNTPLAALLLAIELFGSSYVVPAVLALLIAYLLSNPRTIYRTQKEHEEGKT